MTPEQLKASILQYAIQGKLVEQRPEEGTAEELYQQIQEEKKKLIKERKIKKEKAPAVITDDEIPFDIPDSWKWVRVSTVGITQTGNTPKKSHPEYFGNCIPFLGPGDIQNGNVNYDNQGLSEEGKDYGRVTPAKSVLQVCIGGSIGKCALVDREVTFNQQINSIYPLLSDSKFIYHVLDSNYFKEYIKENAGGTATPIINRGLWDTIIIPLPPLEEQHRIVTKIEELLPYVDRYAEAYEKLKQFNAKFPEDMKKSILQNAIQGKLVEQRPEEGNAEDLYQQIQEEKQRLIKEGKIKKEKPLAEITEDEAPFDIPDTWKWVRLGDIYWYIDAGKSPNCQKTPVKNDEWGVITTTSIQIGYFDDEQNKVLPASFEVNKTMQVHAGDILITRAGPMNRTGIACNVENIRYNLILSDKTLRINMTNEFINKKYIVMILNSPQIRNQLIERMSGMDKQQVNISQEKYKTVLLPIPPLEEQQRIVKKVEELLPYCERLVE